MALDPEADIDLDDDFVMQELFDEEDMRTELFKDTEKFHAPPSISRNSNISIRHADKMLKSRPKDQRRRSSGMMGGATFCCFVVSLDNTVFGRYGQWGI